MLTKYLIVFINIYVIFAIKFCKNCKHYKTDSLFDVRPSICLNFPIEITTKIDVITGDKSIDTLNNNYNSIDGLHYEFCHVVRNSPDKCGILGKKFIENIYYSVDKSDRIQKELGN